MALVRDTPREWSMFSLSCRKIPNDLKTWYEKQRAFELLGRRAASLKLGTKRFTPNLSNELRLNKTALDINSIKCPPNVTKTVWSYRPSRTHECPYSMGQKCTHRIYCTIMSRYHVSVDDVQCLNSIIYRASTACQL